MAVQSARDLIHTAALLRTRGCLMSTCFIVYMTSSAVITLLCYTMQHPDEATAVILDAQSGKETLAYLARSSAAAERSYRELGVSRLGCPFFFHGAI